VIQLMGTNHIDPLQFLHEQAWSLYDLALVLQAVDAHSSVRSFTSVEVWRP
jgi:hypothetical protein